MSRKLESATHRARLPAKGRKNKTTYTRYKLGCLYGLLRREKRRHLLKYNRGEEKNEAENGGYLCPCPLSDGIVLDIGKKGTFKRFRGLILFYGPTIKKLLLMLEIIFRSCQVAIRAYLFHVFYFLW